MNTGNVIKVKDISSSDSGHKITFDVFVNSRKFPLYFKSNDVELTPNPEVFLALTLLAGMELKYKIEFDGEVSNKFMRAMPAVQSIYAQSYIHRQYKHVDLSNIGSRADEENLAQGVGAFFSGGIDSFYTLLKNQEEITHLIFINGFDVTLGKSSIEEKTSELIRACGKEFGKKVIEIETNLRDFMKTYVSFPIHHGSFLAATGHLLSSEINKIFLPAADSYGEMGNVGSHPLLDPLWSSDKVEYIHDGCEASRMEKLPIVMKSKFASEHIRVCYAKSDTVMNCGKCEKCVRTITGLMAINALEDCKSFNTKIDVKDILKIELTDSKRPFYTEILYALDKENKHPEVAYAISTLLFKPHLLKRNTEILKKYFRRQKYRYPKLYLVWKQYFAQN
ncbi:MAG: hypothetical protein K9J12_11970 [Melioribacteraceae bacterium]|nr:hypothetical protein [Melioribacteraceae bacterium]MCF8262884.1 hypothetical protein [Melioribacteraceae bacterium]MCF8430888.1 hypothetical protein [Melioribacteraceae bacterium]